MSDSENPAPIDAYLDVALLGELKTLLDDDFPDLIETFLADARIRVRELETTLASGDTDALRQAAHTFKGSSLNVGAWQIAELCRELEALARSARTQGASDLVERIESALSRVEQLLRDHYL